MAQTLTMNQPIGTAPEAEPSEFERAQQQQEFAREFRRETTRDRLNAKMESRAKEIVGDKVEQMVEKYTAKYVLRVINLGAGSTGIGLVIPFIFMNCQLLLGNLGNLPLFNKVKLDTWEIPIIVTIDIAVFVGSLIILVVFVLLNPNVQLHIAKEIISQGLKDLSCNIFSVLCKK